MRRVELGNGCFQTINTEDWIVSTHFSDGAVLHAQAVVNEENVARARALGYVGDNDMVVWDMTLDHDRIHMELAQAEGLPWSPTLHEVAVSPDNVALTPGQVEGEECRVFYIQAKLNEARR